jgi:hypothetical protein
MTTPNAQPSTPVDEAPRCPRCGYDVSVAVEQWPRDRCPVDGLCTECGLEFAWGEVLSPERRAPWWFIEHQRGLWRTSRAVIGTAWVAGVTPWRAMQRAPLGLRRRLVRPAVVVLSLVLFWYLLGIGSTLLAYVLPPPSSSYLRFGMFAPYPPSPPSLDHTLFWPWHDNAITGFVPRWMRAKPIATLFAVALPVHLLCTVLSFATLRVTLRRIDVQRDHFVRLLLMSFVPLITCAGLVLIARTALESLVLADIVPEWGGVIEAFVVWHTFDMAMYAAGLYLLWGLVFWWCACRWYLRLPAPAFHAATIVVVGTLSSTALLYFVWAPFGEWLVDFLT